jgi:hypothetical protein
MKRAIDKIKAFIKMKKLDEDYEFYLIEKDIIEVIEQTYNKYVSTQTTYIDFLEEMYYSYNMFHNDKYVLNYLEIYGII